MNEPLLTVESVTKRYRLPRQQLWTAAPEVQALSTAWVWIGVSI